MKAISDNRAPEAAAGYVPAAVFAQAGPGTQAGPGADMGTDPFGADRDFKATDPRGADGTIECWTVRGCAGIWGPTGGYMEEHCPHNIPDRYSPCPSTCAYTRCQRPWHREATSFADLLDPDVDRMGANKEECRHCLYFIKHGPRTNAAAPVPSPKEA